MTIIEFEYYQCAVCGAVSQHDTLVSTHSFGNQGWSDLDLRPPRTDEFLWEDYAFKQCPECGYIAEDIEEDVSDEIKSVVLSDEYKKLKPRTSEGKYAALLALSLKKGDYTSALTASRHLAWIYDDYVQNLEMMKRIKNIPSAEKLASLTEKQRQAEENALLYRRKALEILETHEDELTLDFDVISCLKADMYRRCGDFDKVIQFCSETGSADENVREVLRFEVYLSLQNDSACHDVGEAKKYCAKHTEEEISSKKYGPITVPKEGRTWTCSVCGTKGNTSHYCPECGADGWICPSCHHKWNTGDVCDSCQMPKPAEDEEMKKSWSCPECHNWRRNYGKVCRQCGKPKPKVQTWDCPHCHQKGITQEECPKCGFSYWDRDDPGAVDFFETAQLHDLLFEQDKKRRDADDDPHRESAGN